MAVSERVSILSVSASDEENHSIPWLELVTLSLKFKSARLSPTRIMRAVFILLALQRFASRAGVVIRPCLAALDGPGGPITEASVRQRSQRGPPVLLRDVFGTGSPWLGMKRLERAPLQRLNRLQEVADLALEGRVESAGGSFGCADIGAGEYCACGECDVRLLPSGVRILECCSSPLGGVDVLHTLIVPAGACREITYFIKPCYQRLFGCR